jgi:hypothetical protein
MAAAKIASALLPVNDGRYAGRVEACLMWLPVAASDGCGCGCNWIMVAGVDTG